MEQKPPTDDFAHNKPWPVEEESEVPEAGRSGEPSPAPREEEPASEPATDLWEEGRDTSSSNILIESGSAPRRWSSRITGVFVVLLCLCAIGATLWGVRAYRQQAQMQQAALEALGLVAFGAPANLQSEMAALQSLLAAGQVEQAVERLAALRLALSKKPAGSGEERGLPGEAANEPIPESAYQDLPADAAHFFREHEALFREFLLLCARARQLKAQGQNVDELRRRRDAVIEAARLGQEAVVRTKMQAMAQRLRQQADGPRRALQRKADRLKEAIERAAAQGRNVRPVMALVEKAKKAAAAGRWQEAGRYVDEALAAVRTAPRRAARRFGRRPPQAQARESRQNPLAPFARALLSVMTAEENNLRQVAEALSEMRQRLSAATPDNPPDPQGLMPMIDRALGEMRTMAQRRQELTRRFAPTGRPPRQPARPTSLGRRLAQLSPAQRQEIFALLFQRLTPIMDSIRALAPEEYEAQKAMLVRQILRAILEPPAAAETAAAKPSAARSWPADPEQRIRAKLLASAAVLTQWQLAGKDTAAIEQLFAQARTALYARQLAEAERLVDEARRLLGLEAASPGSTSLPSGERSPKAP